MKTVIFDIDGTLANIKHRLHFIKEKPTCRKSFNESMVTDRVNENVAELYRTLVNTEMYNVLLVTGRSEEYRIPTVNWLLENNLLPRSINKRFNGSLSGYLFMRPNNDSRPDEIIKLEILNNLKLMGCEILFVVDDRPKVCRMWRANGVTCLQVNDKEF